ncbi:hypothetical protein HY230_12700, partial [Candidatus Acetothermia bacterium]|nr:hypothetical protein [Candidatus Acetothermia bacterium]
MANYGVDASGCGTITLPCRSISHAIALASDRDRIIVGPGHYGDLNRDGDFEDSGEEQAEIGHGCSCAIKIDKQLSFESSDGAEVTVLDAGGADVNVVSIEASQVVFGKIKLGFTLTGAKRAGLIIADNNISRINIMSNISIANGGDGFLFVGTKHSISDNIASGNVNAGFNFSGSDHQLKNNLALKNGKGFSFAGDRHI